MLDRSPWWAEGRGEIQVTVDINRLNAYALGIDQVARAIGGSECGSPGRKDNPGRKGSRSEDHGQAEYR